MAGSGEGERDDGADIAVASASGRVGWLEWCCKIACYDGSEKRERERGNEERVGRGARATEADRIPIRLVLVS